MSQSRYLVAGRHPWRDVIADVAWFGDDDDDVANTHTHPHTHIYIYTHAHAHTHTHIHTHTHTSLPRSGVFKASRQTKATV